MNENEIKAGGKWLLIFSIFVLYYKLHFCGWKENTVPSDIEKTENNIF